MVKSKKASTPGSPIGYVGCAVIGDETPMVRDNNPDGPSRLPDHELRAYRHSNLYPNQICFPDNLGKGESDGGYNVTVNTADGISNSKGERGMQYNWGEGTSGKWNKNRDWPGSNLTGL